MPKNPNFEVGESYHVYNRGNNKRDIFLDDFDRERFLRLLYAANGEKPVHLQNELTKDIKQPFKVDKGNTLVEIAAYCLMFNHYHLLLHEKTKKGISRFMQKLGTAYCMYFNKRHKKSGTPFEGTYKARHSKDDAHLEHLFIYIHTNPIEHIEPEWKKEGVKNFQEVQKYLENYKYSSYYDYIVKDRPETVIINKDIFNWYFEDGADLKDHIQYWVSAQDEGSNNKG